MEDYDDRNYMDDMEDEPSPTAKFKVTQAMSWSGNGLRSGTNVTLKPDGTFTCDGYIEVNEFGQEQDEPFSYKGKYTFKEQGKSVHFSLDTGQGWDIKAILSDDILKIISNVDFHTELTRQK